jgi:hypothetical protein
MLTKQIWEEAFRAGFRQGYKLGKTAVVEDSGVDANAEAAYQRWLKEHDPLTIDCGTIP